MSDAEFRLHERLAADCRVLGDLPVSRVLLMNDRRFPWLVLVPRRGGLRELHELPEPARLPLFEELEAASRALVDVCGAEKINVGALGNLVPQLHVHVVGRRRNDAAWPGPVWGFGSAELYAPGESDALAGRLQQALGLTRSL